MCIFFSGFAHTGKAGTDSACHTFLQGNITFNPIFLRSSAVYAPVPAIVHVSLSASRAIVTVPSLESFNAVSKSLLKLSVAKDAVALSNCASSTSAPTFPNVTVPAVSSAPFATLSPNPVTPPTLFKVAAALTVPFENY